MTYYKLYYNYIKIFIVFRKKVVKFDVQLNERVNK